MASMTRRAMGAAISVPEPGSTTGHVGLVGQRDYLINGVSGSFLLWFSAAGIRSLKVMAKAFKAGFQRTA
ncbi:MAG: hypothetical protein ABIP92_05655, partial [Arthrobacter sp.]